MDPFLQKYQDLEALERDLPAVTNFILDETYESLQERGEMLSQKQVRILLLFDFYIFFIHPILIAYYIIPWSVR